MFDKIRELIEQYSTIIIHRHFNPDGDAYGSQMGLKYILKTNFPDKQIYAVGDENQFGFVGEVDNISDEVYNGALVIIVDVSVSHLVSDDRYKLADYIAVIDHHLNPSDIADLEYIDPTSIACAQIIAQFAIEQNLEVCKDAAYALFTGMATDSGRFKYPATDAKTFEIAAFLVNKGINIQEIYERLYTETINFKKLRGYFIQNFQLTKNNVAYMKNDLSVKDKFNVTTFVVSRAMVNQMADLKDVEIWANFTERNEDEVFVELRSKRHSIVHIARKYGGGGHALACGCSLKSLEEAELVLNDLDQFLEEVK